MPIFVKLMYILFKILHKHCYYYSTCALYDNCQAVRPLFNPNQKLQNNQCSCIAFKASPRYTYWLNKYPNKNVHELTCSTVFTHENSLSCFFFVLVKDLVFQGHLSPHLISFSQDTPMKPSQVPNLSFPPPKRVLPLLSPEQCHRDRLGLTRQPPHASGPICSTEFNRGSSTNVGASTVRPHHMPRARLCPPPHTAAHSGSFCSSQPVPGRPQLLPPGINHHAPPHFMKDLNNHSRSSPIKGCQQTEPTVILSYSGSKNLTTRSQELHQVSYTLFAFGSICEICFFC